MLKKTIGLLLFMTVFTTALAQTVYVKNNYYYAYPPQPQPVYYYNGNTGAVVFTAAVAGTTGYVIGRSVHHDRYYNNYYKNKYYRHCHRAWNGRVYCHAYRH